jgi:hypothetical protein
MGSVATTHQVDRSQRISGGHVWPRLLDGLNGKHGLAHVISTDCQGIIKSLPDDVLKVPSVSSAIRILRSEAGSDASNSASMRV